MVDEEPVGFRIDAQELRFDLLGRVVVAGGESEPMRDAEDVRVHGDALGIAKRLRHDDVRGLAADARKACQLIHRARHYAAEVGDHGLRAPDDLLGLGAEEPERMDDLFDAGERGVRQCVGIGEFGEQDRRHLVDGGVGALRREDDGDGKRERIHVVERACALAVALEHAPFDLGGARPLIRQVLSCHAFPLRRRIGYADAVLSTYSRRRTGAVNVRAADFSVKSQRRILRRAIIQTESERMLIHSLAKALFDVDALAAVAAKLDAGQDTALGVAASARPFVVAARYAMKPQSMLVIVPGEEGASAFASSLSAYIGDAAVARFPLREDYPFAPKKANAKTVALRTRAAWALASGEPVVVVASAASMVRRLPPSDAGVFAPIELAPGREPVDPSTGEAFDFAAFADALVARGFENAGELDGPGTFCVRGGTVDVFPGTGVFPVRVDFFGDEIDEIRRVVPDTGQSISSLASFSIFPVREYRLSSRAVKRASDAVASRAATDPVWRDLYDKLGEGVDFEGADALLPHLYARTDTLGAYVRPDALVVLSEPRSLIDDAAHAADDAARRAQGSHIPATGLYAEASDLDFGAAPRFTLASIMRVGGMLDEELPVKRTDVAGDGDKLIAKLRSLVDQRYTVAFCVPQYRARQDMKLLFVDAGLPIVETLDAAGGDRHPLKRGVVNVVDVDVPLGMVIPKSKLAIVSIHDLQGRASAVARRRRVDATEITFPFNPGDYVVHAAHGVAFFRGLVRQDVGGTMRDYLQLEYAENDKLFVPVEQLDRITRYVGPEGSSPRLTRLNTSDWSRAMSKARASTKQLAFDLVDVYTRRSSVPGFRYSPDNPWQKEMEDAFPYAETPDQLSAIAEVKADMQSSRPMDRLVCGDVGFGKTEVALRAAFKAVQDDKQVMVLCPTTILAQQHYTTFKDRFEPFHVSVEVLSRFRTPAEQKETLAGFADGTVDVLVGTHRLLSRDVNPRDLGLVIIDEEQRFGVGHKEQLKNLREHIDVLTLSATPIPRTLQMSLSGVRDTSLILTPPDERRPVEVHVGEWDPDIVSDAIRREMQRGGQVYYVSNRVRTIEDALDRVRDAAPEARIGAAHGKMGKEELEAVMEDFAAGAIDVLVATTIIESGIDNPHTNTLVIEDSQRLGLAQMYQLKGRVGRSSLQAYAYFMFPSEVPLTEEATARLQAIDEHRELGSGMQVAMRDLEIRGAGSLLGAEQSGSVSAVGFDLFAQMLATAFNDAREGRPLDDRAPQALSDITLNVPGSAFISEDYVPDTDERVLLYRRAAFADTPGAVDDLAAAIVEAYGEMPEECLALITRARIRAWCGEHGVRLVNVVAGRLNVEPIALSPETMKDLRRHGGRFVTAAKRLVVPVKYFNAEGDAQLLAAIAAFLEQTT